MQTSATGTWFQTPEAYGFYESQTEIMRPFVIAVEEPTPSPSLKGGEHHHPSLQGRNEKRLLRLRGVCVGYVTVEKSAIKQYFTRRAIIIGGPCLTDDATNEEVEALLKAVKNTLPSLKGRGGDRLLSPIYIETRNFNDYSRWKEAFEKAGFEYKKHLNFHVDCGDEVAMWDRLSENRKRQIRKQPTHTLPEGKACMTAQSEEEIREWYGILEKLYRTKVKTPLWPVEFFLEAYRQGVGKFLLVKHNNHIIGGTMITSDKMSAAEPLNDTAKLPNAACGTVYEWFECGMNVEYKEQYPSVMATWAGMKYAAEHGCARYDMMGAGEPDVPYGVRDFKSEFGGELVEHGRYLCVTKPLLYQVGKLGVWLLKRIK